MAYTGKLLRPQTSLLLAPLWLYAHTDLSKQFDTMRAVKYEPRRGCLVGVSDITTCPFGCTFSRCALMLLVVEW